MKIVQIDKSQWTSGIEKLKEAYRVFAPVKNDLFHDFKALEKDEAPDFNFQNTRLSPKSIVYPQSEILFRYSLDRESEEYGILKEDVKEKTPKRLSASARATPIPSFWSNAISIRRNTKIPIGWRNTRSPHSSEWPAIIRILRASAPVPAPVLLMKRAWTHWS